MNDELHMNQFSSSDPHSPTEQVKCLLCQTVPDQYISLDCKDDFCLVCLAQKYYEMKQNHEVLISDYNNYEIVCPACKAPTVLDEASINALEETLSLMKAETKKNELFNEIIMEDSAENYNNENNEEVSKGEEKKSFEAKYYNGLSFLARNSIDEEQKKEPVYEKFEQNYEKFDFFKERKEGKPKAVRVESEKPDEKLGDFKKKPMGSGENPSFLNIERKEKNKGFVDSETISAKNEALIIQKEKFSKNNSSLSSEPRCSKHKNEVTNLFCFTCETACLCVECLVEGVHRNHNVKNVAKGAEFLAERLAKLADRISQKTYENSDFLIKLEGEKKALLSNLDENSSVIQASFREVKQKLQAKEQEILKEIEQRSKEKVSQIDSMIKDLQQTKELFQSLQPPSSFEKLTTTAQINYYNSYAENIQKLHKSMNRKVPSFPDLKPKEAIKNPLDPKKLNYLIRTIESLNQEKERLSAKKLEGFEITSDLSSFNRKLRMESEYIQEFSQTTEPATKDQQITQTSSFLGSFNEAKPTRRGMKSVRNPFNNLKLSSDKSSFSFRNKDLVISGEGPNLTSKGFSRTPTHSHETCLEQQQKRFQKQKEFFFSKF